MFSFTSEHNDDELFDELFEDISIDIISAVSISARFAVMVSPVDTGLFKGNWNISIDKENNTSTTTEDPSGSSTISRMVADASKFDLQKNSRIYIQNNVEDLESKARYAQTVAWDFSTQTADSIVSGAAIVALESLN